MAYTVEQLSRIYDRTSGYCHICCKKLAFSNYAAPGARGAWEVEHSRPKCLGGTDHLNNLYPACITCNRGKGAGCTRKARASYARSRAPLSVTKRGEARARNAAAGAAVGALIGSFAGPLGFVAGALIGGKEGYDRNPDD